jgi:alpha-glucosidase
MGQNNNTEWWRGAVIYQIYPRSFFDTNGDGIGDLKGIAAKLDYVASLGVDGIWISPFFKSPMEDFGYDVSDYRDVDSIFGTLNDFDAVVARAHEFGLKVVIDQVYSHTSNQHVWFEESRQSRDNPKADWYVWADAKIDGTPPNNWQSAFGSAAWTWDGRRQQYYLHNFASAQPDLNLHSSEVQEALLDVARFWLDRGVDGFRLDAINFGMHDVKLRDNPPAPPETRNESRPYFMQELKYNMDHEGVPEVLECLRDLTNKYDEILTIAEVGGPEPLATLQAYTYGDKRLISSYGFDFLGTTELSAERVRQVLKGWPGAPQEGWPSWAFSNHDAPRVVSRWEVDVDRVQRAKLYALLQFSLRGNIFLYQGEELGLTQADVPFEKLQDPEAIANWPQTLGRDGARTPMPWAHSSDNAGFSSAEPWLPVDSAHKLLAVDTQEDDPESVLSFFRDLIQLRKSSSALKRGDLEFLDTPEDLLAFTRDTGGEIAWCVFNLGKEPINWTPQFDAAVQVRASVGIEDSGDGVPGSLGAYCGYVCFRQ